MPEKIKRMLFFGKTRKRTQTPSFFIKAFRSQGITVCAINYRKLERLAVWRRHAADSFWKQRRRSDRAAVGPNSVPQSGEPGRRHLSRAHLRYRRDCSRRPPLCRSQRPATRAFLGFRLDFADRDEPRRAIHRFGECDQSLHQSFHRSTEVFQIEEVRERCFSSSGQSDRSVGPSRRPSRQSTPCSPLPR